MTLWFVFALMTVAAIFAVLWPLGRGASASAGGSEAVVYRDQLAEIERDVAAGLIGVSEAEAARVEIGRRLLAAADGERDLPARSNLGLRRASAIVALVGLPVAAVMFYLALGSPWLGDFPLASRTRAADANQPLENMVAQVEAHLEKNPTDARGWTVLAPVLARLGRYDDAVRAYRNAITYAGDSAERRSDLGEALAGAAGGVVTAEAKAEFERAVAQDANEPRANYFLGLAAEQDGRQADAAAIWRAMLARAPADAPWRPLVQAALTRVGGPTVPALSNEAMAAAKDMSDPDRNAMIRGMVDRLATRLETSPNDEDGWLRLMRSRMTLGEKDAAKAALTKALETFAGDAAAKGRLTAGARELGVESN